jgi:hypothetical protein
MKSDAIWVFKIYQEVKEAKSRREEDMNCPWTDPTNVINFLEISRNSEKSGRLGE